MISERNFLDLQSTAVKARLRHEASALADDLVAPLRLGPLLQRHPWLGLGGATVVGFVLSGGLDRAAASPTAAARSAMPEPLAAILRRARRVVTSTFGALLMVNMRSAAPAAADLTPSTPSPAE
jgi:hypothetical protein